MAAQRNDLLTALSQLDNAVIELERAVRQGPDPVDTDAIRPQVESFAGAVGEVRRMLELEGDVEPREAAPGAESEGREVEDESRDFSEFFATVAESLVDAQKQLDLKSREYLQYQHELARQSKGFRPLPSFFRIPKVSADFKFAIEAHEKRRVGLIFFSDTERASSRHQQSIQFEIASAPPSPELTEQLQRDEPQLELVLAPGTRQAIFREIGNVSSPTPAAEKERRMLLAEENRDRVLMLAVEQGRSYLLLHADEAELKLIGLWQLVLEADGTPRLTPVYKYNRAPSAGEELTLLKDFTLELAAQQAAFLAQFTK